MIAVAMSGGLDSSLVAAMLADSDEELVGLSMLLWDQSTVSRNGRCCGSLDLGDARRVAQQIGIPHYTVRLEEEFNRHVVTPFVQDYAAGRTPSPCIRCNTWIKFDVFLQRAVELGADRIATGHYARIRQGENGLELHRAADETKDQSYFLFELTQQQLARSIFPLGEMRKSEARAEARRRELVVAEKGESMDICFVSGSVKEFVEEHSAELDTMAPSAVIDRDGRRLGSAGPYYSYTVGQRKGLGIAASERLYVLEVQPRENRLVVGPQEELFESGFYGERLSWIGGEPGGEVEAEVRIRSRDAGVRCRLRPLSGSRVEVELAEPQAAVSPGQAAVFYSGTQVLGGCWISAPEPAPMTMTNSPFRESRRASVSRS